MFSKKNSRKQVLGTVAGGALLSASTLVLATPAMAEDETRKSTVGAFAAEEELKLPGVGDAWSGISPIYNTISKCAQNEKFDLPCLQSDGQTLGEIHSMVSQIQEMLDKFVQQYAKDRQRTMDSFDVVVKNQADAEVRQQWQQVQADLETSHIGMKMYKNFLDCVQSAASTSAENPNPTCAKIDINGLDAGTQDANLFNIAKARKQFLDKQHRDADGFGGYQLAPTDFMQRIAGTTLDPYASDSLMRALLDREIVTERAREGIAPGQKLTLYPAVLVNSVGELQTSVVLLEGNYFSNRILAAQLEGDKELADSFQRLADNGREDGSRILSLAQQLKSFTFPDWTLANKLAENEAFVIGPNSGAIKISNRGETTSSPDTATDLPAMEQVKKLAADFAQSGTNYSEHAQRNSKILPIATEQQHRGNPNAAGRVWTQPQEVYKTNYVGRNSVRDGLRHGFQPTDDDGSGTGQGVEKYSQIPIYLLKVPGVSFDRKDGALPVTTVSIPMSIYDQPSGATPGGSLAMQVGTAYYPGSVADYATPVWNLYDDTHWEYKRLGGPSTEYRWFSTCHGGPSGGGTSIMGTGVANLKPAALLTITPTTAGGALPNA